jgi:hypothetical protein
MKVAFILKPRNSDCIEAMTYCPTSMSSFLFKTMKKLVDRNIRDSVLQELPLHKNQFAYQIGKSVEITLHNVKTHNESAIKRKQTQGPALTKRRHLTEPHLKP